MIHHISIATHHPLHVSQVLAELLHGQSIPFPGYPGSHVALALDPEGTMIEVHPFGTALLPGKSANEAATLQPDLTLSSYTANHAAISVPASVAQIQEIAAREDWRVVYCRRGDYFDVIEFWVENQLLIELLPPELAAQYLSFMKPESLQEVARLVAASYQPTAIG
jgi:hypothetical protein